MAVPVYAMDRIGGATLTYSVSGLPAGLSINASTGLISGTIAVGDADTMPYMPTITVGDGTYSNKAAFDWVVNGNVEMVPIRDQSNTEGDAVSLQVHAIDINSSATLTFGAMGLPLGLSITPSTGLISGTIAPGDALERVCLAGSDGHRWAFQRQHPVAMEHRPGHHPHRDRGPEQQRGRRRLAAGACFRRD